MVLTSIPLHLILNAIVSYEEVTPAYSSINFSTSSDHALVGPGYTLEQPSACMIYIDDLYSYNNFTNLTVVENH